MSYMMKLIFLGLIEQFFHKLLLIMPFRCNDVYYVIRTFILKFNEIRINLHRISCYQFLSFREHPKYSYQIPIY